MFTDITLFEIDRQKFFDELRELNQSGDPDASKKAVDINSKFRDKIRKYLPTCLNIINTNFNCKYSLYKVGRDYDANFRVIETNVKKDRQEVESELNNLKNNIDYNSLDDSTRKQLDLAIEILVTYVDDGTQKTIDPHLLSARPVASSIIKNIPMMSTERVEQRNVEAQNSNIQYNPYADMPVNLDNNQSQVHRGKFGFILDDDNTNQQMMNAYNDVNPNQEMINSYSNINSNQDFQQSGDVNFVQQDYNVVNEYNNYQSFDNNMGFTSNGIRTDTEYANSDVIDTSALSIFGVGNNNNNNQ